MKTLVVFALFLVAVSCDVRPANKSYNNSSNDVRQNNTNVNTNTNINANTNVNANVKK